MEDDVAMAQQCMQELDMMIFYTLERVAQGLSTVEDAQFLAGQLGYNWR